MADDKTVNSSDLSASQRRDFLKQALATSIVVGAGASAVAAAQERTTAAKSDYGVRGSQKLLEHLAKNGEVPSLEALKEAFRLPASTKIPYWLTRGTPADYLQFHAVMHVPIANLGELINSFVKLNDSTINLNILINGIPIPDIAQVVVRNVPGEL